MPLRRGGAKAFVKPLQPLRAERDLRQQHQDLPAGGERGGDRGEIGLGLARAGDAVEHGDAEPAGLDPGRQAGAPHHLVGRQGSDRGAPPIGPCPRRRLAYDKALLEQPAGDQVADHRGAAAGQPREPRPAAAAASSRRISSTRRRAAVSGRPARRRRGPRARPAESRTGGAAAAAAVPRRRSSPCAAPRRAAPSCSRRHAR